MFDLVELVKEIKARGITAYKLAQVTGLSEVGINKILDGKTTKPREKTVTAIGEYLKSIPVYEKLGNFSSLEVNEPHEVYFSQNTNGNKFESLPNSLWRLTVDLIPVKAYAKYVSESQDAEYVDGYDQVSFVVDRYARGNYKAFEIKGDSMDDGTRDYTPDKAIALGRELLRDRWPSGFRDSQYGWIIVTNDNIVFKDITAQDLKAGIITCHSRNPSPEYSDFQLSLDEDVRQIFKVIKRQF